MGQLWITLDTMMLRCEDIEMTKKHKVAKMPG